MLAITAALITVISPFTETVDCAVLYQKQLASDLTLSWEAFDQTEGAGFRVLAAAGCSREAGDLIEAYLVHNQNLPRRDTLDWHLAQMRAEAGQSNEAIVAAKRSIRIDETADEPFKWNAYVNATIAFLEKNRPAFDNNIAVLAAHDEHPGNAMNLRLLRKLEARFDSSYLEALSSPAQAVD